MFKDVRRRGRGTSSLKPFQERVHCQLRLQWSPCGYHGRRAKLVCCGEIQFQFFQASLRQQHGSR